MSELTLCNYCSFENIKQHAKAESKQVVTRESKSKLGGTDVYLIPAGVKVPKEIAGHTEKYEGDEFSKKYFVVWFWKLTDHCAC